MYFKVLECIGGNNGNENVKYYVSKVNIDSIGYSRCTYRVSTQVLKQPNDNFT